MDMIKSIITGTIRSIIILYFDVNPLIKQYGLLPLYDTVDKLKIDVNDRNNTFNDDVDRI